jgi:hypothetical protein
MKLDFPVQDLIQCIVVQFIQIVIS